VRLNFVVLNGSFHDGITHANPITLIKINFGVLALRTFLWSLAFVSVSTLAVVHACRVETAEVAQPCERWIYLENKMVA
jgi:hypothetical protein